MVTNNPAQPSTANEVTTADGSKGGLFNEPRPIGIDLAGVMGEQGPQGAEGPAGPEGPAGAPGSQGPAPVIEAAEVDLPAGSDPTAVITSGSGVTGDPYILTIGIPRGNTGEAAAFATPNIITGPPASNAMVSIAGTGEALDPYILTFTIPRGDTGDTGPMGMQGIQGPAGLFYVPVFYNSQSATASQEASLTIFDDADRFAYVSSTDTIVFGNPPSITNFNAINFINEVNNNDIATHVLGANGAPGDQGPQGPAGMQGPVGPQGPIGNTGEDGLSIVSLYFEQFSNLQGSAEYRDASTVIATNHNRFAPVRTNNTQIFPLGYDLTSDADQWTQNDIALRNFINNNDIEVHELGGVGPPGPTGDPGTMGADGRGIVNITSDGGTGLPSGDERYVLTINYDDRLIQIWLSLMHHEAYGAQQVQQVLVVVLRIHKVTVS